MPLDDNEFKKYVSYKWDSSSETYDTHYGHGIKSDNERDAWKKVFSDTLVGKNLRILDVGSGTGEITLLLAKMGHTVQGLDISDEMINKSRKKAEAMGLNVLFEKGDAEKLPFEDSKFDVVVNRHLLWTLPHPDIALKEWTRVVKDGGHVLVIDGVWRDGSVGQGVKRFFGNVGILFIERKNPWKSSYSHEIREMLPHRGGAPAGEVEKYMTNAGLIHTSTTDLTDIRKVQMASMPLRNKIGYNWSYYLVQGQKGK